MSFAIDGFAHVMPMSFAKKISELHPTPQLKQLLEYAYFGDMENRVRVLDKYKIDKQVLTIARPDIWMNMSKDLLFEMTRYANDTVAEAASKYPDRFIPVGTLPVPTEEFLPEFDRCMNELGMAGIQVFSNVDGKYLDAPEFRAFFEKANATKTPVWLHPQLREEWSKEFILHKIIGWPYDTTMAMCRLVLSGLMEQLPDLKIITHHLGGMVPYFSDRIKGFYDASTMYPDSDVVKLSRDPLEYFKCFYNDTVLNGAVHACECGYEFFGAEHIIFASDYPFGPGDGETWMAAILKQMEQTDIPSAAKELIYSKNIEKLLDRS